MCETRFDAIPRGPAGRSRQTLTLCDDGEQVGDVQHDKSPMYSLEMVRVGHGKGHLATTPPVRTRPRGTSDMARGDAPVQPPPAVGTSWGASYTEPCAFSRVRPVLSG